MVNRCPSGTGQEGDPALVPQSEPLLLQITHQTIKEGDNNKEAHKNQKTSLLCLLHIFKVPEESMEDQRQTLNCINQETLRD